jgi:hypothetical protein
VTGMNLTAHYVDGADTLTLGIYCEQ